MGSCITVQCALYVCLYDFCLCVCGVAAVVLLSQLTTASLQDLVAQPRYVRGTHMLFG